MANERKRDLALEALAAMQVMEAEAEVIAFREEWLGGLALSDWEAAMEWLRANAGTSGPATLDFRFEEAGSITIPLEILDEATKARAWWTEWLLQNLDKLAKFPIFPGCSNPTFTLRDEEGRPIDGLFVEPGSALAAFDRLVRTLADRYHWSNTQTQRLVLLGETPFLQPVRAEVSAEGRLGLDATLAAGPGFTEITLRCRPQATQQEVADWYEAARRHSFEGFPGLSAGERIRAVTSERTRDQAILGARIAQGEFESWRGALDAYLDSHKSERLTYAPSDGEVEMGRFRRDTRAAYKRVVGFNLDFRPTKRQRREIDVEILDEQQPGHGGDAQLEEGQQR